MIVTTITSTKEENQDVPVRVDIEKKKKKKKERREDKKKKKKKKKKRKEEDTRGNLDYGKEEPERKRQRNDSSLDADTISDEMNDSKTTTTTTTIRTVPGDNKVVFTSALDFASKQTDDDPHDVTLLLFYQYVEPPWDAPTYLRIKMEMQELGDSLQLTGRMRVAKEGLNCTLTSTQHGIVSFCKALRQRQEFRDTEFKLTTDLPRPQRFASLKIMPVNELVHYGLAGKKAPPMEYTGTHLQPKDYHKKLAEPDTVVIDVRNHYEAAIGHFDPPHSTWIDPQMRKSTEFPMWLDKEETKAQLKGKQVLMYCTGGVRCERASALLKYKMETDDTVKALGIQGVYQLQGGIDKYFKEYPGGGYWAGKNYTFDKRFAHAPPKKEDYLRSAPPEQVVMGKCEACRKPWDMYRGKRRCPTCGVPSLICRDCFQADKDGVRRLDKTIRCELCVQQGVMSKSDYRQKEQSELEEYESKLAVSSQPQSSSSAQSEQHDGIKYSPAPNPNSVTRLLLKNMCRKSMDEATLLKTLPGITHVVWRTDRTTGQFYGSAWVEMSTAEDAARAVGMNGIRVIGRPLYLSYQPPDGKDAWPPPSSRVFR